MLALSDVTSDLRRTDNFPQRISDWRDRERDIDARAVFAHPHGFVMIDDLAALQAFDNGRLFIRAVLGNQSSDRPSDHLFFRIPKNTGGAGVPAGDYAAEGLADDCVVRRSNDRGES